MVLSLFCDMCGRACFTRHSTLRRSHSFHRIVAAFLPWSAANTGYIRRNIAAIMYIHQVKGWPALTWDNTTLLPLLADIRHKQGRLLGRMEGLGFRFRSEVQLSTLTEDVIKSSAIEGERLDADQVRSSIARRLGLEYAGTAVPSRDVEGIVEMMLDATQRFSKPLTKERLFGWHAALFPTGYSGLYKITVAEWRKPEGDPMQVVSGPIGREKVHFEAPAARKLEKEMAAFLTWFEKTSVDPVLKSGIAHLWFVTIHPFADGNGRIGRAIADLALARSDGTAERFYSMSAQIEAERKEYYNQLEAVQRTGLEVTPWLTWFLECLRRAIEHAEGGLQTVLKKTRMWERINPESMNERQRKVINRLFDDFEGNLTSSKYAKLAKCSSDTALRDIKELLDRGVLKQDAAGGRSTNYRLAEIED
jgi:Fic family protein